jgi:hypothetical protein
MPMSGFHPTTHPTSDFPVTIIYAVEAYKDYTGKDLLTHPLFSQLQACNSPDVILAVLQQLVHDHGLGQSHQTRSNDDRWTKWLEPTIKVLYVFSEMLKEPICLVSY